MIEATYQDIDDTCLSILSRFSPFSSQGSVFQFLYNTGCRVQEAIQLKRISLTTISFIVDTEKKSLDRTFDISLLPPNYFNYLPFNPSEFSVKTLSSYTSVIRAIFSNADKMYFKDKNNVLSNIFRYRYALFLQNNGLTLEQIRAEFGHISVQSTLSYLSPIYY